ncbi:MAG: hypothetical protein WCL08_02355 [Verrucomicrobiota bacterium]
MNVPTLSSLPPNASESVQKSQQPTRKNPPSQRPRSVRLRLLQEYDRNRFWSSLADRRLCLLCDSEFEGSAIRISVRAGKPVFQCPQATCHGELSHFVHLGNPLLNEDAWADWMKPMAS